MKSRCVALLSGGLDSMLAIRIMQQQGVEVEAVNFQTLFTCCRDQAGQAARELDVRLTVIRQEDDYLDLLRHPRFGYGRGANPCVDCRIYMFQRAKRFMQQVDAQWIVSGDVLGQRPMSQKRRDLEVIAHHSQLDGLLLRPLSAKLFLPTQAESAGWVDRQRLYAFRGRGRKELIELARSFGLTRIPPPSTGCALTEPKFSTKVHDLIQLDPASRSWDFELLRLGRHFRTNQNTKVIVGRNAEDNDRLRDMFQSPSAHRATLMEPENFVGPTALLVGTYNERTSQLAGGLILRHSRRSDHLSARVRVTRDAQSTSVRVFMTAETHRLRNVTDPHTEPAEIVRVDPV
jgi:tRNA U34 2-thiouridine synthase MnmA/TrmU